LESSSLALARSDVCAQLVPMSDSPSRVLFLVAVWIGLLVAVVIPSQTLAFSIPFQECSNSATPESWAGMLPSQVRFSDVTQHYPVTWTRRLFSSEPRRHFAVRHITLKVSSCFLQITGASSSGKSTILRLIHGQEQPSGGAVEIASQYHSPDNNRTRPRNALPIYLDAKPSWDHTKTLEQYMDDTVRKYGSLDALTHDAVHELKTHICTIFAFDVGSKMWLRRKAVDLSPSESYRFRLILACLQSSLGHARMVVVDPHDRHEPRRLPAPILLLDEWMDQETSSVVQTVLAGLRKLVQAGAVVVSVTHKPERWKTPVPASQATFCREIVLCRGEILSSTL
jgi:energy-coupling factor transporter ATP-binding protein EcfA2